MHVSGMQDARGLVQEYEGRQEGWTPKRDRHAVPHDIVTRMAGEEDGV